MLNALGRKTMGWTEYAAVDPPAGSVVQHWAGDIAPVLEQVASAPRS